MNINLKIPWSSVVAITVGIFVLLGYLLAPADPAERTLLVNVRDFFLETGVLLSAVAMLVGIIHLIRVHWNKARTSSTDRWGSAVVLVALLISFALGTIDYFTEASEPEYMQYLFNYVQFPLERSFMALLVIALAYAAIRMLRKRMNAFTIMFLLIFLVILLGTTLQLPFISSQIRPWIEDVIVLAGTRGLLLGIALGALAAGIRVLTGVDRPYGG